MNLVDLRSDTVTRPSEGMRRAMAAAEVGDDVFGDDPTVNRLQDRSAEIFGFEAGTKRVKIKVPFQTGVNDEIHKTHPTPPIRYRADAYRK